MFRKLCHWLSVKIQPSRQACEGPYLVLPWSAINQSLSPAQRNTLQSIVNQVNRYAPSQNDLLVIQIPADTSHALTKLAVSPTSPTRH